MAGKDKNLPVSLSAFIEAHASDLVSAEQLREVRSSLSAGESLGYALVRFGYLPEARLVQFLGTHYNVNSIDLDTSKIDPNVIKLVPREMAERLIAVPVKKDGKRITVAMADPGNLEAIKDLRFCTKCEIDVVVASDTAIYRTIVDHYGNNDIREIWGGREPGDIAITMGDEGPDSDKVTDIGELEKQTQQAPIIRLAEMILLKSIKSRASDIHFEPFEKFGRIRLRIDGQLKQVATMEPVPFRWLVSRIKVMARMNLAESRLPQDGRFRIEFTGDDGQERRVDFRVATNPVLHGEKVVLRILDKSALSLQLDSLGFDEDQLTQFRSAIHRPHGIVLVTGPTGSGKTTTLYAALKELHRVSENISTVEDPIEIEMEGINQSEVNPVIGYSFLKALRAFLRQDPDIIMVGEIRDFETAEIATQAALTGHLVLSTLHANSAVDTIIRLKSMGVDPSLICNSLRLTLAQRLVRRLCARCKRVEQTPVPELIDLGFTEDEAGQVKTHIADGCVHCNKTGYKGRNGIYEVLPIGHELRQVISEHDDGDRIAKEAARLGMRTLRQSALEALKSGWTSVSEVLRITASDD